MKGEEKVSMRRVDAEKVTRWRIRERLNNEVVYVILLQLPETSVNCYQLA